MPVILVTIQNPTDWVLVIVGVLAPIAAVAIAVGSARRDNRLRQTNEKELRRQRSTEEKTRALREAQKVVWTHRVANQSTGGRGRTIVVTSAIFEVINASDGPIINLAILSGIVLGSDPDLHWEIRGGELLEEVRVLQSGERHEFVGTWYRNGAEHEVKYPPNDRIKHCYPELYWLDGAQRRWTTDGAKGVVRAYGPQPDDEEVELV